MLIYIYFLLLQLTDFGLSKVGLINSTDDLSGPSAFVGDDKPKVTLHSSQKREQRKKHSVVGTPDYLAPEILLGMGHGLPFKDSKCLHDEWSDIVIRGVKVPKACLKIRRKKKRKRKFKIYLCNAPLVIY